MSTPPIDLDRLLKLRLVVARFGEMDLAKWWNTKGQLGRLRTAALRRGFPRTHRFAQARSVVAVAAHRCAEIFDPPKSVTSWRLPEALEEEFDARWELWLDHAAECKRVAAGLLKLAVDFGLLRGSVAKEFASYHLPEPAFLYLLHAMLEDAQSPAKVISSSEWRMFLMRPSDVEHELLRLHQYRKLDYQVAGSLVQLSLPCATPREYAERMVA